jgi:hypothetical protein
MPLNRDERVAVAKVLIVFGANALFLLDRTNQKPDNGLRLAAGDPISR